MPVCFWQNAIGCPANRRMSIEDITTELRRGKNNERDFVITAEVITTRRMDQEDLDSILAEVSQ